MGILHSFKGKDTSSESRLDSGPQLFSNPRGILEPKETLMRLRVEVKRRRKEELINKTMDLG